MPGQREAVKANQGRYDETTATQLGVILSSNSTILSSRAVLGSTFRGSAYCQIICSVNKAKRLQWAQQYADEADSGFFEVVYTASS